MLENETETDACMRICLSNLTRQETEIETSTEMAYIEGATARNNFIFINDNNSKNIEKLRLFFGKYWQAGISRTCKHILWRLDA